MLFRSKYLSAAGMAKSKLLYGLPQASYSRGPLVIVEGASDVWRLRTNALALLGKSLSDTQRSLICRWFAHRPLVVFLDRDAGDEALKHLRACAGHLAPVVVATLPDGRKDVGECTRAEAWDAVAASLGKPLAELDLATDPLATE